MTTDYKSTINLPQTAFAMKADLAAMVQQIDRDAAQARDILRQDFLAAGP